MQQLQDKYTVLMDGISQKSWEIFDVQQLFNLMKARVCSISEESIQRLVVELETGGNIRLEDGKPSDVWYSSCVDLLNSRFFAQDFRNYGTLKIFNRSFLFPIAWLRAQRPLSPRAIGNSQSPMFLSQCFVSQASPASRCAA